MKTTLSTVIAAFLFAQVIHSQILPQVPNFAQSEYQDHHLLVYFSPNFDPNEIIEIQNEFGAQELWISPLSQARYWFIPNFNFEVTIEGEIFQINNIIDALEGIKRRSNEDEEEDEQNGGTGLSWIGKRAVVSSLPGALDCYEGLSLHMPLSGSNVDVGISDSGYTPDITPNPLYTYSPIFTNVEDYLDTSNNGLDQNGHGTHILSLIENTAYNASQNSTKPVTHSIMRMLNHESVGNLGNLILSVEEAIVSGSKIINLSLGFMSDSPHNGFLDRLFLKVKEHNVLVIIAAGNNNINIDLSKNYMPASYNNGNIITVASIDCRDELSKFSNYGNYSVDIAAPGENLLGYDNTATLVTKSGTSQATAVVTGVAAMLATHQAVFNARAIKCAIVEGSQYAPTLVDVVKSSGIIDAQGALTFLLTDGTDSCSLVEVSPPTNAPLVIGEKLDYENKVYPNPFHESISITSSDNIENINVYNLIGEKVYSKQFSSNGQVSNLNVDLNSLESGIYMLSVKTNNSRETYRLVKN